MSRKAIKLSRMSAGKDKEKKAPKKAAKRLRGKALPSPLASKSMRRRKVATKKAGEKKAGQRSTATQSRPRGPAPIRLSEYDLAVQSVVAHAIDGFVASDDLLGQIRRHPTQHVGPIRQVQGPRPLDSTMERTEATAEMAKEAFRKCDIDAHTLFVYELAQSMIEGMSRMFFRTAESITDATGNIFDAGGRPLSCELWLEMLEKAEFSFDADGNPQMPYLIAHPSAVKGLKPLSPEQERRRDEILHRKKEEHAASKRTRRLSRESAE
jgi:hypothetical protein